MGLGSLIFFLWNKVLTHQCDYMWAPVLGVYSIMPPREKHYSPGIPKQRWHLHAREPDASSEDMEPIAKPTEDICSERQSFLDVKRTSTQNVRSQGVEWGQETKVPRTAENVINLEPGVQGWIPGSSLPSSLSFPHRVCNFLEVLGEARPPRCQQMLHYWTILQCPAKHTPKNLFRIYSTSPSNTS